MFEYPSFDDIRHGFQHLLYDRRRAVHHSMWHLRQKDVASWLWQLLDSFDATLT